MKIMNRRNIGFLLIALLIGSVSCNKKKKEYKDVDAVFQKVTKVYTLHNDGSIDYQYKHKLDLRSYYAFNRLYGETFIVYNPETQKLTVNKSETETKEGNKIKSPENAYNKVLPHFAEGAPPYSHLREMVITHTGLEKNSTINLDYKLESDKDFAPFLMKDIVLAKRSPIRELNIKVRFPENKELNYRLLNAREKLNISKDGDYKVYEWKFNNVQKFAHDHGQPAYEEHLPRLIISSVNFDKAYTHLTDQFSTEINEDQAKKIIAPLDNKNSKMDTILAIQDRVINHMNQFDIPPEYTGFKLKSNNKVISNNGGTPLEKTILLSSLLNKLGFDAEVVGILPNEHHSKELGNLSTFKEFYVKLQPNEEILYLSGTHNHAFNAKYKYPNEVNIILNPVNDSPKFLEPAEEINTVDISGELEITKFKTIYGTVDLARTYCENPFFQIKKKEDAVKSLLEPGFSASNIQEEETKQSNASQIKVHYEVNQNIQPQEQGNYWIVEIPHVNNNLNVEYLKSFAANRTTPLQIAHPIHIKYQYSFAIPEKMQLKNQPTEISKTNKYGSIKIHTMSSDKKVEVLRELTINTQTIPPAGFDEFKDMLNLWIKDKYNSLILEKIEDK